VQREFLNEEIYGWQFRCLSVFCGNFEGKTSEKNADKFSPNAFLIVI
jgi:hypothetical protein